MELTLDQALQKGIEAHKAGNAQEADRYYTAILKANPKHPDANHNMGVLAVGVGKVQEALPFFETALEANPAKTQFWLSYIDALIKLEKFSDAKTVLTQAKSNGAKGKGFEQIGKRLAKLETGKQVNLSEKPQEPPVDQLGSLIGLYERGQSNEALDQTLKLLEQFPKSVKLYNILGVVTQSLGKLENAIDAFTKAITIKPDYAEAHNNMGIIFKNKGQLEKAIEAYSKAISINPNFTEAYGNMGYILQEQGQLEKAVEAYNKAISTKPDYAEAYNNMGIALKEQGKLEEAKEAYSKAISIKPDYAEAHRNLSNVKKYTVDDEHLITIDKLHNEEDLSDDARCNLSFALAKIYEDINEIDLAFSHLSKGNALRKKLLGYSIEQDKKLFKMLKKTQPFLFKNAIEIIDDSIKLKPIFILGMPRSGTTLVEQILSLHSEVTGAGELKFVDLYGGKLAMDSPPTTTLPMYDFRNKYLFELSNLSNRKHFVTDKMPQNFLYIPLIVSALPEAKIIHVERNPSATCWSNYKHYFASKDLGFCYDLKDVVEYYKLYSDLMTVWLSEYSDKIYNLNYEKLTTDQENQTRKLIKHLGLNWEEACLSPQENKRSVRTASQQQVRQKVYQGSSEAWRKYEQYLNGAFDSLTSF